MSNRTTLKSYFITNAIPKQGDFADLIDSSLVQTEDSIRKQGSDPVAIQAQQADQNGIQQVLHFYKNFNDANAAWKLSLLTQNAANPASGLSIGSSVVAQSSLFIKEADGNVGIGISNPVNKFEIGGDMHTNGNAIYFRVSNKDKMDYVKWNGTDDRLELAGWNGINMGYTASDGQFKNTMALTSAGNIGIGNINPRSKLDVGILNRGQLGSVFGRLAEGDNTSDGTFLGVRGYKTQPENSAVPEDIRSFAIEHSFYGQVNSSINFFRGGDKTGGFIAFNTNNNTERVRIDYNGNVGIGTTTPGAKLHVAGSLAYPLNGKLGYLNINGASSGNYTGNVPVSILTSDRVIGAEFDAISDKRIKKDFVIDDSQQSLEVINRIQIKNFLYKDEVRHGSAWHKGVIAQEVEDVFPEAVTTHTDFVPDIYSLPQAASVRNNILTVTMKNPHFLVTDNTVRLITDSGTKEVKVTKASDITFSVNNWEEESTDIFVYGKRVNDCRAVNYNSIFCLGISAIQELYKQLQQLRKEADVIKERMPAALVTAM